MSHFIFKLKKTKDKEKMSPPRKRGGEGAGSLTLGETRIKITSDFSSETMQEKM